MGLLPLLVNPDSVQPITKLMHFQFSSPTYLKVVHVSSCTIFSFVFHDVSSLAVHDGGQSGKKDDSPHSEPKSVLSRASIA